MTLPPNAAPEALPGRRLLMANLLAQIAFGLFAMTLCLPSMPQWGALFAADQAAVQLTFSAYVLAFGATQLIYGPLSDRHGRQRILLAGLALALAGSGLAAFSASLPVLTAARALQGAGSAAGMVLGRAMVQDLFHGPQRTRIMAYIGMVMGLCPPLAALVGGQVHVRLGWQANFVLTAGLALVLMLAAWRGLPTPGSKLATGTHWLPEMAAAYARLAREPAFLLYVGILSMTYATFYVYLCGAPIVLASYGVGPQGLGGYMMFMSVSYFAGNYLTSRLIAQQGERRIMAFGQGAALGGVALMLALGLADLRTPLAFAVPMILLGIGHGFLMPPTLAGSVGQIPALAGSAAAVAGLMQQGMGAVGAYAVGLVPHQGVLNLGWLMMGFTLCALAAQLTLHRRPARG